MMRPRRWFLYVHCAAFVPVFAAAAPTASSVQNPSVGSPQSRSVIRLARIGVGDQALEAERALQLAYRRLGISLEFVALPAARALAESNAGHVDGEVARMAGIEAAYPNLRRIEPVLVFNDNAVFVLRGRLAVPQDVKTLASLPVLGVHNGYKTTDELTAGWSNVVRVNTYEGALKMLAAQRISAFFGRKEDVEYAMAKMGLEASAVESRVLSKVPLYHYLNKRHDHLRPAIADELRRMRGKQDSVLPATKVGAF